MTYETLEYVDAGGAVQEVALQNIYAGGSYGARLQLTTQGVSEFAISLPQAPETPIIIPFKSRCKVRACRSSATGANNSFSGGTIIFQGRRTDTTSSADGAQVNTSILLSDAWWDLKHVTFQNVWKIITGGPPSDRTYGTESFPDVVLFQATPDHVYDPPQLASGLISTWQQIVDIINYATTYAGGVNAVQLQIGSVPEFTPSYVNFYPVRSMKCADAIAICLRPHPGVYSEIDYSTTPPTLHFRNRASMTAQTLPYKSTDANGVVHVASDIQPLPELIPDRIALRYKINSSVNGQSVVGFDDDIYPIGAQPTLLSQEFSIDVSGVKSESTSQNFVSQAFNPFDGELWRTRVPSLAPISRGGQVPDSGAGQLTFVDSNPYDAVGHPKGVQVFDDNNNPINYTTGFKYLTDDNIYSWFTLAGGAPAQAIRATVKAFFNYSRKTNVGATAVTENVWEHEHSFRVLLTNAPSGTYALSQALSTGEEIPPNLAQNIWTELHDLQWRIRHEVLQLGADQDTVPTIIKPGRHKVNLSGGAVEWANMNAVPEAVEVELMRSGGRLLARNIIRCGPVNRLEPGYMVQLYNMFTNRDLSKIDTSQRLTGELLNGGVDLSGNAAKENSVPAEPIKAVTNIMYADPNNANAVTQLQINAQTGEIFLKQFFSNGTTKGAAASIRLSDISTNDALNL